MSVNFLLLTIGLAVVGGGLASGDLSWDFWTFLFVIAGWIAAVSLHEWGHAFVAWRGGDKSVEMRGYLTLDPFRYTHPMMSIVLPLIIVAQGGIGFPGGAVYIDQERLKGPVWRAAVSLAGPAMTALVLFAIAAPFALFPFAEHAGRLGSALALLAYLQATALLLNLLPVPGLDGFGVIEPFLPASVRTALAPVRSGVFIVILVVFLAAPQVLAPLWDAALAIVTGLGVPRGAIADGYDALRFWWRF